MDKEQEKDRREDRTLLVVLPPGNPCQCRGHRFHPWIPHAMGSLYHTPQLVRMQLPGFAGGSVVKEAS